MGFESYIGAQNMGTPSTFHEIEVQNENSEWNPLYMGSEDDKVKNSEKMVFFHPILTMSTSDPMYRGVPVGYFHQKHVSVT